MTLSAPPEVQTEIACCVCGETRAAPWRVSGDNLRGGPEAWTAVRCVQCGTRRLEPRPALGDMARFYAPDTYARAEEPGSEIGRRLDTLAAHLAARASCLAPRAGAVLDVGCGDGRFLHALQSRGWHASGTETDPVAAGLARARTSATIYEATLENLEVPPASFDLVTLLHVLEHVPDPRETLGACFNLLKPNGALFVAVPNAASPEARLFGAAWYHLDLPRHLWGFTPPGLLRLAREAGFAGARITQYPLLFAPQSVRNLLRRRGGEASAPTPRGSGGRGQTRVFNVLLAASEVLGALHAPGEIMELVARR